MQDREAGAGEVRVGMPTIEQLLIEIREGQREIREGQAAHRQSVGAALDSFTRQCHEQNLELVRQGGRLDGACDDIAELKAAIKALQPTAAQHGMSVFGGGVAGGMVLVAQMLWDKITGKTP